LSNNHQERVATSLQHFQLTSVSQGFIVAVLTKHPKKKATEVAFSRAIKND
jgi:hypothetical protein